MMVGRRCAEPAEFVGSTESRLTDERALGVRRRRVCENAPLQNQFSKTSGAGWASVEQQWQWCISRSGDEHEVFQVKIDIAKAGLVAHPAFRRGRNNRAQNLAALQC